jgi:hypothetical protein
MKNRGFSLILLIGFLMVLTGCTGPPPTLTEVGADISVEIVETEVMTPTINVCKPLDIPGVAFPRQEPVSGPRAMMAAELVGDFVLEGGCLWVESLYHDGRYLPIWPPEFLVEIDDGMPVLLDGDGVVVGRVGEEIYMGGGEASERAMLECVRAQMPTACGGPYWVVGDGVRFNLKFDSDLINLVLVPAPDRTAILLQKEPILDEWADEPGTVTGVLSFYYPDRCPRIQSESGTRNYLPIWPPGYSLQISDDLVEILDDTGGVVARQDETITLKGALVPPNWENENYRRLHYETPGDCFGPYWIVMLNIENP